MLSQSHLYPGWLLTAALSVDSRHCCTHTQLTLMVPSTRAWRPATWHLWRVCLECTEPGLDPTLHNWVCGTFLYYHLGDGSRSNREVKGHPPSLAGLQNLFHKETNHCNKKTIWKFMVQFCTPEEEEEMILWCWKAERPPELPRQCSTGPESERTWWSQENLRTRSHCLPSWG